MKLPFGQGIGEDVFVLAKEDYGLLLAYRRTARVKRVKSMVNEAFHKANQFKSISPCSRCENPAEYLDSDALYCSDHAPEDAYELSMHTTLDHPDLRQRILSCMPSDLASAEFRDHESEAWYEYDEYRIENKKF